MGGHFATIDIVGQFRGRNETGYQHKYWDGHQWNPAVREWYDKGGDMQSQPALLTWGNNNLHIFGEGSDGQLKYMTWTGYQWLPWYNTYYDMGDLKHPYSKQGLVLQDDL